MNKFEQNQTEPSVNSFEKPNEELSTPEKEKEEALKIQEKGLDIIGKAKGLIESLKSKLDFGNKEKAQQTALRERLEATLHNRETINLEYKPEDGIATCVSKPKRLEDKKETPAIVAEGFFDCCALVMQTPDSVAIMHVSPYVYSPEEGGPTEYSIVPRDTNYESHMNTIFHQLLDNDSSEPQSNLFNKEKSSQPLTEEQLAQLENKLRITIVGGDKYLSYEMGRRFQAPLYRKGAIQTKNGERFRYPQVRPTEIQAGTGQKSIVATPESIFGIRNGDQKVFDYSTEISI